MFFFELMQKALKNQQYDIFPSDVKNIELTGITSDSRYVREGYIFAALPGFRSDGVSFIQEAVMSGAKVIVTEADEQMCFNVANIAYVVKVKNAREAFALLVKEIYGNIDKNFDFIGVTGTNGKTSSTHYISHILNSQSVKTAVIGTLGGISPDVTIAAERTTPDCQSLFEMLSVFGKYNTKAIAMEVSSHALELKRTFGIRFKIAVFTNLTQDHLDFHKNMNAYMKAKLKLFEQAETGLINIDDVYGARIKDLAKCKIRTYSLSDVSADYYAKNIRHTSSGSDFVFVAKNMNEYKVHIQTPGTFSVYNAICSIAASIEYGINVEEACKVISDVASVPGRFESVKNTLGINIIIDYAHTPDGIKNVLSTAREFTSGKLISVFGCGGDRDKEKRALMGKISSDLSDYTVITSDNPRSENELKIACDISVGTNPERCNIIINRETAIEHAILCAEKGDTVIIMGKGHETYQQFGKIKLVSNDRDIVTKILSDEHFCFMQ